MDPFGSVDERQAPALTRWSPRSLVSSFARKGIPLPVLQTLDAWEVDSLPKLASELGEQWIWFNQPEKSAHIRQWPPLVTLAMSLAEHSTAASSPYFQLPPRHRQRHWRLGALTPSPFLWRPRGVPGH